MPLVYDWSGFYLGGHIGYALDHRQSGIFDQTGSLVGSVSTITSGLIGGAQIGFNYAVTPAWILGLEADFTAASLTNTAEDSPVLGRRENKTADFGTIRTRIGYAWNRFMVYGTGGYAWAHEEIIRSQQAGTVNFAVPGTIESSAGTVSGWAAGVGLEWGVSPGWTLRAEYLHLDLGSRSFAFPTAAQQIDASAQIDAVRVGVNYIFNIGGSRPY
jgi:opacity protein-like surface antigen